MTRASDGWIDIIEASYKIERNETDWLHGVLAAAHPKLDRGCGTYALSYELNGNGIDTRAVTSVDLPEGDASVASVIGRCQRKNIEAPTMCGTGSQLIGMSYERQTSVDKFKSRGVRDIVGINVRDPTSFGCIFVGLMPDVGLLAPREVTRWKKISAHVASGFRLQRARSRRNASAPDRYNAILNAKGVALHAEPDAQAKEARAELRAAVLAFEDARTKRVDAIDARKGLVSGRWTLLEHFEASGRRYFIARENAPANEELLALTPRERQVLSYAALGQSDKLIAYQLGVAWSTVRVLMQRARSKLGTVKRAETVQAFKAMSLAAEASEAGNPR